MLQHHPGINAVNNNGTTPLHIAAQNGRVDVVDVLLQNRADTNAKQIDGATPLCTAVRSGHFDVVYAIASGTNARRDG